MANNLLLRADGGLLVRGDGTVLLRNPAATIAAWPIPTTAPAGYLAQPDFNATSPWIIADSWMISGGQLRATNSNSGFIYQGQANFATTLPNSTSVALAMNVLEITPGTAIRAQSNNGAINTLITAVGLTSVPYNSGTGDKTMNLRLLPQGVTGTLVCRIEWVQIVLP